MNAFLNGVDDWDSLDLQWQQAEERAIDAQMDIDIDINQALYLKDIELD